MLSRRLIRRGESESSSITRPWGGGAAKTIYKKMASKMDMDYGVPSGLVVWALGQVPSVARSCVVLGGFPRDFRFEHERRASRHTGKRHPGVQLMSRRAWSEGARHPRDARHNGGIAGKKVGGSLPGATDVLRFSWHVAFPAAY